MNNKRIFKLIIDNIRLKKYIPSYVINDDLFIQGDSLKLMKFIPSHSISLVLTDPPYHSTNKKNILGDTSFKKDKDFIQWLTKYAKEWHRVLKHNGSVFCFCSPQMEWKLENSFSKYFNILSSITWTKPNEPGYDGWKNKMDKSTLRQWYPYSERIIFMSPKYYKTSSKSYFSIELKRWRKLLHISGHQLTGLTGQYGKINHGGAVSNWEAGRNIPSRSQYYKIVNVLKRYDNEHLINFPKYNDIIRPFHVTNNYSFTDVWDFKSVKPHKYKHPAEKPVKLLENALGATTYQGDIILDTFSGSGSTALAARNYNRRCISMELDKKWFKYSIYRLKVTPHIKPLKLF